ncbi:DUF2391 family protein [Thermococcus sp. 21S7]|uniref:DUF2391 family protein n=1 Tax=Thermococcus sp. 21S7 TaxID=1638221 RepID=UPI001439AA9A|nr:DUF2391 family protein [Thermococcus sp. 21S7]NJE61562.1 DUF2391 family protein [Thermococcus sp. 21S7]
MMSESNTDRMMNPEPEHRIENERRTGMERRLEELYSSIEELKRENEMRKAPDKLGWDDIAQEIVGAVTFALPFLFTAELWEIAKDISIERAVAIFLMTLAVAYLFIAKSRIGNLKREELFHVPKRLLTVALIAYLISAGLISLYGINWIADFNAVQYLNATVLVSTFAVIGAITVDMVK